MWKAMWRIIFQTFQSINSSDMPEQTQIVDIYAVQLGLANQLI